MMAPPTNVQEIDLEPGSCVPEALLVADEPWVARGLVADWPLVSKSSEHETAIGYLKSFDAGHKINAFLGEPKDKGRFFYNDAMDGFNFVQVETGLSQVLDKLSTIATDTDPAALYVGSTNVDRWLPGLRAENDLQLPIGDPLVSLWVGNRSRVAAHFDYPRNLACCVLGQRRFTVFPPEQLENLYIGPWDITPAGQPISLVDFHNPDLARFPRFEHAWASARVAELGPGDVLYLPGMWWHHVESLAPINGLVNYWWSETPARYGAPVDALTHALLSIKSLPPAQRRAWRVMFDHYVFNEDTHALDHIPTEQRGRMGNTDDAMARRLRAELTNRLKR